jgi:DNA repair ATPase RecN
MKKNKKIFGIIMMIIIVMLTAFGIYQALQIKKVEYVENPRKEIGTYYQTLTEMSDAFNEKHEQFESIMNDLYYTKVTKEISKITTVLKEYDDIVNKMKELQNKLSSLCEDYYLDSDAVIKCNTYSVTYQNAIKVYTADIEGYNGFVSSYNEWATENGNYKTIEFFSSNNVTEE